MAGTRAENLQVEGEHASRARACSVGSVNGGVQYEEAPGSVLGGGFPVLRTKLDQGGLIGDGLAATQSFVEVTKTTDFSNIISTTGKRSPGCLNRNSGQFDGGAPGSVKKNQHIIFFPKESDLSKYSDSVADSEADVQRLLKVRQRSRKKKNMGSLEKKQMVAAMEGKVLGSPKAGKREKRMSDQSTLKRRALSLQEGGQEDNNFEDDCREMSCYSCDQLEYGGGFQGSQFVDGGKGLDR